MRGILQTVTPIAMTNQAVTLPFLRQALCTHP